MYATKKVKEIMIDIFRYPHVPYWFTLDQVIKILKIFITQKESPIPFIVLVFDEQYNLKGLVGLEEIFRGLEMGLVENLEKIDEETVNILFTKKIKNLVNKQVHEIMIPVSEFINAEDPISKAVYLIIHHKLQVIPVLENKKLVGIVRLKEIFNVIVDQLIEED